MPGPEVIDRERQARRMRLLNVPMRAVLSAPFRTPLSGSLMLAHLTGRRSGRHYRVPLSYVRLDDGTLLTPGGGRWKLNLVAGMPERLRIAGRDLIATPEVVSDVDEVETLIEQMVARHSRILQFSGIERDSNGRLDRAQLEAAVRGGFRIVRWSVSSPEPTA